VRKGRDEVQNPPPRNARPSTFEAVTLAVTVVGVLALVAWLIPYMYRL
jgi:hypothetical protein